VLIFRQGRIVAELTGAQISKERISELSYAVPEPAKEVAS
jgi:hypothetical protein